jgi:hypothetical protein
MLHDQPLFGAQLHLIGAYEEGVTSKYALPILVTIHRDNRRCDLAAHPSHMSRDIPHTVT